MSPIVPGFPGKDLLVMYLRTCHGTFVVADRDDARLRHVAFADASGHGLVDIREGLGKDISDVTTEGGSLIKSGPLAGYVVYTSKTRDGFYLPKTDIFYVQNLSLMD